MMMMDVGPFLALLANLLTIGVARKNAENTRGDMAYTHQMAAFFSVK